MSIPIYSIYSHLTSNLRPNSNHHPPHPTHQLQQVGVIYGNPEITSGGMALKYYASVRLEVRIKEKLAGEGGQVGIRVKAKCVAGTRAAALAFFLSFSSFFLNLDPKPQQSPTIAGA